MTEQVIRFMFGWALVFGLLYIGFSFLVGKARADQSVHWIWKQIRKVVDVCLVFLGSQLTHALTRYPRMAGVFALVFLWLLLRAL